MNKLMKRLRGGVALGSLVAATGIVGGSAVALSAAQEAQGPDLKSGSPLHVQRQIASQETLQAPVQTPQVPVQRPVVPMQTPSVPPTRIEPARGDNGPGPWDITWGPTEEEVRSTVELGSSIESVFAEFNAPNSAFPIGDKVIYQWISGKVEGTTERMTRVHHEFLVTTDRNGTILDMSYRVRGQWTGPAAIVGYGI
jgi:hypothetical protein